MSVTGLPFSPFSHKTGLNSLSNHALTIHENKKRISSLSKGYSIYDVHNFFGFFTPGPGPDPPLSATFMLSMQKVIKKQWRYVSLRIMVKSGTLLQFKKIVPYWRGPWINKYLQGMIK